MKKAVAFSLTVLLSLPIAAAADPVGDYAALVTAAKEGDPGTDYTAMRQAYAMIPDYDPYGEKTNALMRDGQAAYVAKDCKTALEKFKAAIALDFIISDAMRWPPIAWNRRATRMGRNAKKPSRRVSSIPSSSAATAKSWIPLFASSPSRKRA
jgi:hypothetical protein